MYLLRNIPVPEEEKTKVCQPMHKNLWLDPKFVLKNGIPVHTVSTIICGGVFTEGLKVSVKYCHICIVFTSVTDYSTSR